MPKEAKKGQKQIDLENEESLVYYRNIAGGAFAIYVVAVLLYLPGEWKHYLAVAFTAAVYGGCYQFMAHMVGQGLDLNVKSGMGEHAKDILLVTAIIQTLSIISNYFWLLWLVVPGYAFYLLWVNILGPWFFAEAPPEMDEKQMKKMERKMNKVKYR